MTGVAARTSLASGEDRLIEKFFRPLARGAGAFDLEDDAAILTPPPGHDVVLKTDAIVGGVHFFPDDPPDAIGRKALRVNLSDLAAKGARPAGFLLTLGLPDRIGDDWLAEFARGLGEDVARYDCPLLGGDTVKCPDRVVVSIAAFGLVPQGSMVRRSGAKPSDLVLVTGTIGDAALGLALRRDPDAARRHGLGAGAGDHLLSRYLVPEPRNALADILRQHASAAMDVSDGLAGDLAKLCRASGVSAEIDAEIRAAVGCGPDHAGSRAGAHRDDADRRRRLRDRLHRPVRPRGCLPGGGGKHVGAGRRDRSHCRRRRPSTVPPRKPAAGLRSPLVQSFLTSAPIPQFASLRGTFLCELRNQRSTSNLLILVRLWNLKFLDERAAMLGGTSNSPH